MADEWPQSMPWQAVNKKPLNPQPTTEVTIKIEDFVETNPRNPKYICGDCGKGYSRKGYLEKHFLEAHIGDAASCTFCDGEYRCPRHDTRFDWRVNRNKKHEYKCGLCPKTFDRLMELKVHSNNAHPVVSRSGAVEAPPGNEETMVNQHQDGMGRTSEQSRPKTVNNLSHGSQARPPKRQRATSGFKPYSCTRCPKAYSKRSELHAHEQAAHPVRRRSQSKKLLHGEDKVLTQQLQHLLAEPREERASMAQMIQEDDPQIVNTAGGGFDMSSDGQGTSFSSPLGNGPKSSNSAIHDRMSIGFVLEDGDRMDLD